VEYSKCPDYKEYLKDKENYPEEYKNFNYECTYPYYGLAPHKHDIKITGSIIGSTAIVDKSEYPDNFDEDPESPGAGVYSCPYNNKCENN
jgi:hypothetical protein